MSPSEAPAREVLGIEVTHEQLLQWRAWTMPVEQAFVVPRCVAHDLGLRDEPERVTFELKDAFLLYGVDDQAICWLDRAAARALPASLRRAQPTRHLWRSGPNCFGAVLAAAGVDGAREEWMQREPIEAWLRERTRLLPRHDTDDGLGVVHVWRTPTA